MCKKCKCCLCLGLAAAAIVLVWMMYQRMSQSKEISHDGCTLVKDMKTVFEDSKCVCKDAKKMEKDMVDETIQMKKDLVKDVKNAVCGCDSENENI